MNEIQAKRFIVLSALSISGLIFFLLPSEIFFGNPREFVSTSSVIMLNLVLLMLISAAGMILPMFIPSSRWKKTYAILLGGGFLALWVSGVFLVGDFGELDGASFDLSKQTRVLVNQDIIFSLVLVAGWFLVWKWPVYLVRVIAVIGAGLLIIGAFNFYQSGIGKNSAWQPVSLEDLARFSTGKNLVIVLMDTFQSDVLQQIIDQNPRIGDELEGFTFYPDTLGVAPSTYLTMPAFHSGKLYNNIMTVSEYYDIGVEQGSFLVELAKNGYQVDLINPISGTCPAGANICKRQENLLLHATEVTDNETSRLADLAILRVAPGRLKRQVFDGSSGPIARLRNEIALSGLNLRIYQGNTVLKIMADNLWTDEGAPTVKFIHLFNTHPPFMFDRDCEFIGVQKTNDRTHMTMQAECAMRWFLNLADQMKNLGVYDNSMIILTADTGAGNTQGSEDIASLYAKSHGVEAGELGRLIGSANPVLAIKFPGARGALQTMATQAQLTDIPKTVCESLQACTNTEGINLREGNTSDRERFFKYYKWKSEYWGLKRIPGMIEYAVTGPLWLRSSWARKLSDKMPVTLSTVNFSSDDVPEIFGMGWGKVEVGKSGDTKRWATDKRAELYLPLPVGKDLVLEFELLNARGLSDQEMTVRVNGEVAGSLSLGNRYHVVSVTVPSELVTQPVSLVTLEFTRITTPAVPDKRSVSVSFFQLDILQLPDG